MKPELEVVRYDVDKNDYHNVVNYDERRYVGSANEYKKKVIGNAYEALMGSLARKWVLDVGCVTGRGLVDFAGEAEIAIGTDASHDMLTVAAQKLRTEHGTGFVQSYAQHLPFPDAHFDVVTH